MSKLYGSVQAETHTPKTQCASSFIEAWLQTAQGRLTIAMSSDGTFTVQVSKVRRNAETGKYESFDYSVPLTGNINDGTSHALDWYLK